jgi:archaellum biogenesis protein FlaJ (TadC family)
VQPACEQLSTTGEQLSTHTQQQRSNSESIAHFFGAVRFPLVCADRRVMLRLLAFFALLIALAILVLVGVVTWEQEQKQKR